MSVLGLKKQENMWEWQNEEELVKREDLVKGEELKGEELVKDKREEFLEGDDREEWECVVVFNEGPGLGFLMKLGQP